MVRDHQPGEAVFKSILPEDVDWKPFPAFPPAARLAVLVGEPPQAGPYLIRVKVPPGVKLMPHKHPEDRIYTVISGVFYVGLGDRFDEEGLRTLSHQPFLLLTTCLNTRLGFNKFNGLARRQGAAREPFLARCDGVDGARAASGSMKGRAKMVVVRATV